MGSNRSDPPDDWTVWFLKAAGVAAVVIVVLGAWASSQEEARKRAEQDMWIGRVVINKIGEKGIIQYVGPHTYTVRDKNGWIVTWPDCEVQEVK